MDFYQHKYSTTIYFTFLFIATHPFSVSALPTMHSETDFMFRTAVIFSIIFPLPTGAGKYEHRGKNEKKNKEKGRGGEGRKEERWEKIRKRRQKQKMRKRRREEIENGEQWIKSSNKGGRAPTQHNPKKIAWFKSLSPNLPL